MKSEQTKIASDVMERRRDYFEHSKKTNRKAFMDYRNDVMTEDERKMGQTIIDHFRESYDTKNALGVFKDMEIAEAYWAGEFYNKAPDAIANTNIINTNVETRVADVMDQNIDLEPHAYDPSDEPYMVKVRRIGDKVLDANDMPKKIQRTVRRCFKYGSGWFRVLFNPKMLDGAGCPEIASISPANIFPDASISNIDDIHKGRYFIEVFKASLKWAEDTFGMEKASAILPEYRPYIDKLSRLTSDTIDTTGESYLHILYWCKYTDKKGKQKLRLVQCSGCGIILKDSMNYEEEHDIDVFPEMEEVHYPYWVINDMERENSIWGKTNASLLYPVQDTIDEIDNSIIANARLTGNPVKLVLTQSGIDPEKIDNTEGQVVPTNVVGGLSYVQPPSMAQYIIDRRTQALTVERAIVSRVSDQQAGVKQHGVDTATESLALQQNAMKATDAFKTILQLVLADMIMYCIELAIEFWDKDMFFEMGDNEFDYFNPSMLKKIPQMIPVDDIYTNAFKQMNPDKEVPLYMEKPNEYRKICVIMNVSIGAGLPKNKSLMYNIIKETYANQAMDVNEYREKLEEYVGLPAPDMEEGYAPGMQEQDVNIPMSQSRDVLAQGVNPKALDRMEAQRTGGNFNVAK